MRFHDRREAGKKLAEQLREAQRDGRIRQPIVLAVPRGGVPVADEIAQALHAPLDVVLARKIGAPADPEFGVGAVAGEDPPVFDQRTLEELGLTPESLEHQVARERIFLHRAERLYRRGRPPGDLRGRTVIVVDDGLATGVTARAALRAVRGYKPARVILALPVCSPHAATLVEPEVGELLCLQRPPELRSISEHYEKFDPVGDEEVISTLRAFLTPH